MRQTAGLYVYYLTHQRRYRYSESPISLDWSKNTWLTQWFVPWELSVNWFSQNPGSCNFVSEYRLCGDIHKGNWSCSYWTYVGLLRKEDNIEHCNLIGQIIKKAKESPFIRDYWSFLKTYGLCLLSLQFSIQLHRFKFLLIFVFANDSPYLHTLLCFTVNTTVQLESNFPKLKLERN